MSDDCIIFKAFDKFEMIYKLVRSENNMVIDAIVSPMLHGNARVDVYVYTHYFVIHAGKDDVPLYCIDFTIDKLSRTVYPKAVEKLSHPQIKKTEKAKKLTNSYEMFTKRS